MTEQEWLTCKDTYPMLDFFLRGYGRGKRGERKRRLFACICCRLCSELLTDARSLEALIAAEQYVDGQVTREQLKTARRAAGLFTKGDMRKWSEGQWANAATAYSAMVNLRSHMVLILQCTQKALKRKGQSAVNAILTPLFRDIIGPLPFRPIAADPLWLTSTVLSLAEGVYNDRAFDRLPILAHALEKAGCDNNDIIQHCRSEGPHVRGCWVVDLLLGKN